MINDARQMDKLDVISSSRSPPRLCMGRIRCIKECIESLRCNLPFPEPICYVASETKCKMASDCKLTVYCHCQPSKGSEITEVLTGATNQLIYVSAEELYTAEGQWARLLRIEDSGVSTQTFGSNSWVQLSDTATALTLLHAVDNGKRKLTKHEDAFGVNSANINSWPDVLDHYYCLRLGALPPSPVSPSDHEAVCRLRAPLPNWSLDHDEDLVAFLCAHTNADDDGTAVGGELGNIRRFVHAIDVSSYSMDDTGAENLTDGDPDTFWESDGNQGNHWIRLLMKKKTVIKKLSVTVNGYDDNYLPCRIVAFGGELENLKKLNDVSISQHIHGINEVAVLEQQQHFHPVVEIRIKKCKDNGIDTRIHGITIQSNQEKETAIGRDLFSAEKLVRFPKLDSYDAETLYRRSIILQRFMTTLDKVLMYMSPAWQWSVGSFESLETVRQLLPLSKKRVLLIDAFLKESESRKRPTMPKLYINRRSATDHKAEPTEDYSKSIFAQIYQGLQPRNSSDKCIDYRWPSRYSQWWECKFLHEGIIDQGGGFRDSLSDLSEELCPTASSGSLPLPFFCRAPNQSNIDSNIDRDVYVPNPNCKEYNKYEWIGKIMGACLRGKENLILSLPAFFWKKLTRQKVTWARDYISVDAAEVKLLEKMLTLDEEAFVAHFGDDTTWTIVLSDGSCHVLSPDTPAVADALVTYDERHKYARLVQGARMSESDGQLDAIRRGLLQVIPDAVLRLITWQELERRICGDPEISVEVLKKCVHFEDIDDDDSRRKFLSEVLENFSNEDRSRFLRFITGRRRLPAIVYVYPAMSVVINALPESSTCANILYMPKYSNARIAEEKLRYAIYNCVAIDTDVSPWDE